MYRYMQFLLFAARPAKKKRRGFQKQDQGARGRAEQVVVVDWEDRIVGAPTVT